MVHSNKFYGNYVRSADTLREEVPSRTFNYCFASQDGRSKQWISGSGRDSNGIMEEVVTEGESVLGRSDQCCTLQVDRKPSQVSPALHVKSGFDTHICVP